MPSKARRAARVSTVLTKSQVQTRLQKKAAAPYDAWLTDFRLFSPRQEEEFRARARMPKNAELERLGIATDGLGLFSPRKKRRRVAEEGKALHSDAVAEVVSVTAAATPGLRTPFSDPRVDGTAEDPLSGTPGSVAGLALPRLPLSLTPGTIYSDKELEQMLRAYESWGRVHDKYVMSEEAKAKASGRPFDEVAASNDFETKFQSVAREVAGREYMAAYKIAGAIGKAYRAKKGKLLPGMGAPPSTNGDAHSTYYLQGAGASYVGREHEILASRAQRSSLKREYAPSDDFWWLKDPMKLDKVDVDMAKAAAAYQDKAKQRKQDEEQVQYAERELSHFPQYRIYSSNTNADLEVPRFR